MRLKSLDLFTAHMDGFTQPDHILLFNSGEES